MTLLVIFRYFWIIFDTFKHLWTLLDTFEKKLQDVPSFLEPQKHVFKDNFSMVGRLGVIPSGTVGECVAMQMVPREAVRAHY